MDVSDSIRHVAGSICCVAWYNDGDEEERGKFRFALDDNQAIRQLNEEVKSMKVDEYRKIGDVSVGPGKVLGVKLLSVIPPSTPPRSAEEHRSAGNEKVAAGDFAQALMEYRRGLQSLKDTEKETELEIALRLNAALCLSRLSRWREAAAICDRALEIDSDRPKALFRRGVAFQNCGEYELAIDDLSRASFLCPDDAGIVKALTAVTKLHDDMKQRDRAEFRKTYHADVNW